MKFVWEKGKRSVMNYALAFAITSNGADTLHMAAINAYRVFEDGVLTGYGPARTSHGYVREDYMPISPDTKEIVVEVVGYNCNSYAAADEPPFFGAELMRDGEVIATTDDFEAYELTDRVVKIQRYSFQRPFAEYFRMGECRTHFYKGDRSIFPRVETEEVSANVIIPRDIPFATFEREPATLVETGSYTIDDTIEPWTDRAMMCDGVNFKGYPLDELEERISDLPAKLRYSKGEIASLDAGHYQVYDTGRSVTGFFEMKLTAKRDSTCYVVWDEIDWQEQKPGEEINVCFYRNDCCSVIKYELKAGEYHNINFEPTTMRYVKIVCVEGELDVHSVHCIKYENSMAYNLKFSCSDKKLEAIVSAASATLAQNSVDIYTDCPQRERAGWLCDSYWSGMAEKLLSGSNLIEHNFLQNYAIAPQLPELPEGMLGMCYPGNYLDNNYIPNWAMWYIEEYYDYYTKRGGDLYAETVPKIKGLIKFFEKYENEYGLLEDLEQWIFVEWSKANEFVRPVNYPTNMLYGDMLKKAGILLGDESLVKKGEKVLKTVREQSFNGKFFVDNAVRDENGKLVVTSNTTETCQYYALYFGLATKESDPEFYEMMLRDFGPTRDDKVVYPDVYRANAFIGNYIRLHYFLTMGERAKVMEECADYFYYMAERTGTLWEHAGVYASLDHGFASMAAKFITECVTGYVGCDTLKHEIYLADPVGDEQFDVSFPIDDCYFGIKRTLDGIELSIPEGYTIVRVK